VLLNERPGMVPRCFRFDEASRVHRSSGRLYWLDHYAKRLKSGWHLFRKVVGTFSVSKSGWHLFSFKKWLAPFQFRLAPFPKSGWHLFSFKKWLAPFSGYKTQTLDTTNTFVFEASSVMANVS
jgi:hypothetical protein